MAEQHFHACVEAQNSAHLFRRFSRDSSRDQELSRTYETKVAASPFVKKKVPIAGMYWDTTPGKTNEEATE